MWRVYSAAEGDTHCSHNMLLATSNALVHKVSRLLISQAKSRAN